MTTGTGMTDQEEKDTLDARYDRTGVLSLALMTTLPADDGTGGVEVSGTNTNYVRKAISPSTTDWNAASGTAPAQKTGPKSAVTWGFPTPKTSASGGVNWGDVVGVCIYESTTMRHIIPFAAPVTINADDPAPQFDSLGHQITLQLGDPTDPF